MTPDETTPTPEPSVSLANLNPDTVKQGLVSAVEKRMIDRYADDVLKMVEDRNYLQSALNKYNGWLTRVDAGDTTAIKEFRKERGRLESEDDYTL